MDDRFDAGYQPRQQSQSQVTATYSYDDIDGRVLYEVLRIEPGYNGEAKTFRQRSPDGAGGWKWGLNGQAPVLYRLGKISKARAPSIIFCCEGEKDVESLEALGLLATCNPMGAGKWRPQYSDVLAGHNCFLLQDNDTAGAAHVQQVKEALKGKARAIVVLLPGLPPKGDVSDWLKIEGNDKAKLLAFCQECLTREESEKEAKRDEAAEDDWVLQSDDEVLGHGKEDDLYQNVKDKQQGPQIYTIYSLPAMLGREFPEPVWVVPGIFSEGLNILAGKPKQGKSIMALNLGITVAAGGLALKDIKTNPGDVLYLSLEDKYRRIKFRSVRMIPQLGVEASVRLKIATAFPRQDAGGLKLLDLWAKSVKRPTLAIIDVWSLFRPVNGKQQNLYERDYMHLGAIKAWGDRIGCTTLVLMHCRKGGAEDALEEVSGTMGLTGVADGILVLTRVRGEGVAEMFITGRDVADHKLALKFDSDNFTWTSLGDADQVLSGKLQIKVSEFLKRFAGAKVTTGQIADYIEATEGKSDKKARERLESKIRMVCYRLVDKGLIKQVGSAWAWLGSEKHEDEY